MPKSLAHQGMAPGQFCNTAVQLTSDYSLMGSSRPAFIDLCYEGGSFMLKYSKKQICGTQRCFHYYNITEIISLHRCLFMRAHMERENSSTSFK